MLSRTERDDRPWVAVTPDGVAHAIWNDGAGVRYFHGRDSGQTWAEQPRISEKGGSSHMAAAPGGELAVRITDLSASGNQYDEGADAIAVSIDGGSNWLMRDIPGNIEWDSTFSDPSIIGRWVEALAWGPGSVLYHLWSEGS